jgi:hypothetical protein
VAKDRQGRLGDVHDPEQVGADLPAEVLQRDVLDRGQVSVSGVVDDDVEAPELAEPGGNRALRSGRVGDVECDGQDLRAVALGEVAEGTPADAQSHRPRTAHAAVELTPRLRRI